MFLSCACASELQELQELQQELQPHEACPWTDFINYSESVVISIIELILLFDSIYTVFLDERNSAGFPTTSLFYCSF